ncbi:MAG: MFS transporter, partial [Candidatus Eisenbacteria bacterium]
VLPSTFVLYASHRYGWDARQVGLMLALVGVCSILMQALVVRPFVARFGERAALLTAIAGAIAGYALYGLAATGPALLASVPVFALAFMFMPAMQGLMSSKVDSTRQGELQGANGSIMGITGVIGPTLFAQTFALFIGSHGGPKVPGAAFFLASAMMAVAAVLAWRATATAKATGPAA